MPGFNSKRRMSESREPREISVDGLTKQQLETLNHMWSFDTLEELELWASSLRPGKQREVQMLMRMVLLAKLDHDMEQEQYERPDPYPEANAVLRKFRLQ